MPNIVEGLDNLDVGVFVDAANVWGVDYDSSIDDKSTIRSSAGVALNLMTPIVLALQMLYQRPLQIKLKHLDLTWVHNFNEIYFC